MKGLILILLSTLILTGCEHMLKQPDVNKMTDREFAMHQQQKQQTDAFFDALTILYLSQPSYQQPAYQPMNTTCVRNGAFVNCNSY